MSRLKEAQWRIGENQEISSLTTALLGEGERLTSQDNAVEVIPTRTVVIATRFKEWPTTHKELLWVNVANQTTVSVQEMEKSLSLPAEHVINILTTLPKVLIHSRELLLEGKMLSLAVAGQPALSMMVSCLEPSSNGMYQVRCVVMQREVAHQIHDEEIKREVRREANERLMDIMHHISHNMQVLSIVSNLINQVRKKYESGKSDYITALTALFRQRDSLDNTFQVVRALRDMFVSTQINELEPYPIHETIANCIFHLRQENGSRDVRIIEILDEMRGLFGNKARFKLVSILSNLIRNAQQAASSVTDLGSDYIQAMEEYRTVHVNIQNDGKTLCIKVRNTSPQPLSNQKITDIQTGSIPEPSGNERGRGLFDIVRLTRELQGSVSVTCSDTRPGAINPSITFTVQIPLSSLQELETRPLEDLTSPTS